MGEKKCVTVTLTDDVTLTVMKFGTFPGTVSLVHGQVMLFRGEVYYPWSLCRKAPGTSAMNMVVASRSDLVEGCGWVVGLLDSIGFPCFVFDLFFAPVQKHPVCAEGVSWQLVVGPPSYCSVNGLHQQTR